jgi:glycerate 2-kinase
MSAHRQFLEQLYDVAVSAAHPRALVENAIASLLDAAEGPHRVALIAIGKAAPTMAAAAVAALDRSAAIITHGMSVGADEGASPHAAIRRVAGDHPGPGPRSFAAAEMLDVATGVACERSDAALVLISGGATSLVAAPVAGVSTNTLIALNDALLRSGWDITAMNAVRKRFLRWGAGRLAMALAPLRVHLAMLSDVVGDDPGTIASGPCSPDPNRATEILDRLPALRSLSSAAEAELREYIARVGRGDARETPKPGDPAFDHVTAPIARGNRAALRAVADHAQREGWTVHVARDPLTGDARERGMDIARTLLAAPAHARHCIIHGGETTVTLAPHHHGLGGRCQELALAAAQILAHESGGAASIALLAAGTDGRDGPSDAAGAIIDRDSWHRSASNGGAPQEALATHDSHRALAAAGALLPARVTGTNVMDIVVGLASGA